MQNPSRRFGVGTMEARKVKVGHVLADGKTVATVSHHEPTTGYVTMVLNDGRTLVCELGYLLDARSGPREVESMVSSPQSVDATLID